MRETVLLRRRIDMVRNVFLAEGGWRLASSLYLIGGFARGEGTWDIHRGKLRIYNDLDLLAVIRRRTPGTLLRLHRIARRLNDGRFDHTVDLEIASLPTLLRPPSTLLETDLRASPRLLWGEDPLAGLGGSAGGEIRPGDALQLLFNRQASALYGLRLLSREPLNIPYLQVQICKPLLAMMAATLALEGRYVSLASDQLSALLQLLPRQSSDPLWQAFRSPRTLELLETAVRFKSNPEAGHFEPFGETLDEVLRIYQSHLFAALARLCEEPSTGPPERLLKTFRRRQPRSFRLLSLPWWAHAVRSRQAGVSTSLPRVDVHPQVDVYIAHTRWLADFLDGASPSQLGHSRLLAGRSHEERLESLIRSWQASGFGCRLE